MLFATALIAFVAAFPALAAPTTIPITKRAGSVKANSYIITFKDSASQANFLSQSSNVLSQPGSSVTYNYAIIPALAAIVMPGDIGSIRQHPGVESIEQDGIVSINYEPGIDGLGTAASKRSNLSSQDLVKRTGAGVVIYGIDTGIYIGHSCFNGRASWGATFGGYADQDGNGHGTHTAGTAVGDKYGVATAANIVAVKVLSDSGSGAISDVVSGVQYAFDQYKNNNKPSIATMSLGGTPTTALDDAVRAAIAGGLHFTVAAGNGNALAETSSPADVEQANTIGAVDSNNQKASFSNYGKLIDVWAPGVNILSAWIGSPDATNTISGTSMATPFVAGVLAVALGEYGSTSPETLSDQLKSHAAEKVTFATADAVAATTSSHLLAEKW